jgi:hypothetical protein
MDKPKKIIYKVKYEFEFEITKEVNEQGKFTKPKPELTTKLVDKKITAHNFDDKDIVVYGLFDMCNYLELHFPNEIAQLYNSLVMESTFFCEEQDREARNIFIAALLKITEARTRKRIAAKAGRNPDKMKNDYDNKKDNFEIKCIEILKNLQIEGKKLTQQNLADAYFTDRFRADQKKPLLKKLKLYEISWKELLAKIPKNIT